MRFKIFTTKSLWALANLVCTALLALQLGHVLEGYVNPTITRTWEKEVGLEDIDFPVNIKICVIPGFNQTALQEVGYEDTWRYFLGQSMFNQSVYGWAGHSEDSGTIGTVSEVLARVSDFKIENIFDRVFVWTDEEFIDIPWEHLTASKINYPDNCHSLALSSVPEMKDERIQQAFFYIKDFENHTINIPFNGATLDCRRNIREHSFQASGDAIKLEKEKHVSRAYMVNIAQRVFVEEDPEESCRDYPNEEFLSYQHCDDQFVRSRLNGLTPVWLTEDFAEVSTQSFDDGGLYGELFF